MSVCWFPPYSFMVPQASQGPDVLHPGVRPHLCSAPHLVWSFTLYLSSVECWFPLIRGCVCAGFVCTPDAHTLVPKPVCPMVYTAACICPVRCVWWEGVGRRGSWRGSGCSIFTGQLPEATVFKACPQLCPHSLQCVVRLRAA